MLGILFGDLYSYYVQTGIFVNSIFTFEANTSTLQCFFFSKFLSREELRRELLTTSSKVFELSLIIISLAKVFMSCIYYRDIHLIVSKPAIWQDSLVTIVIVIDLYYVQTGIFIN